MLTYVLFMLVIPCHFSQFADRSGTGQCRSATSAPNYCRSKSASSPKIVIKYIVKSDAKIYFSRDCGHGWHFKSICTAPLAKYFENEEGKLLVGPTFAQ